MLKASNSRLYKVLDDRYQDYFRDLKATPGQPSYVGDPFRQVSTQVSQDFKSTKEHTMEPSSVGAQNCDLGSSLLDSMNSCAFPED